MDVALLSRMVGELMPDLDSLSLPGLGTFRAELMGASFSDKGYTINPPYRRLTFSSSETQDGLLADAYASSNGITPQEADKLLRAFSATLARELRSVKSVELPGLGRLRATREDHFFFVPDQDLDISPEACGLKSVSLRSHAEAMPELPEIPSAKAVEKPVSAATVSDLPKTEEATGAATGQSTGERKTRKPFPPQLAWAIGIVAAAAVFIGAFVALSRIAPDFTDKLLYTPEQLAIINAPEDGTGISR